MEEPLSDAHTGVIPDAAASLVPPSHAPSSPGAGIAGSTSLAPWYHTLGIVLLLLAYAFLAHLTHHHTVNASAAASRVEQTVTDTARAFAETPKVAFYGSTMMLSWMLLASVVAGLYHRRTFFAATLKRSFRSRWADPAAGVAIYLSFLTTVAVLVVLLTLVLTVSAHHAHPKPATGSAQTPSAIQPTAATSDEEQADDLQARVQRVLHVDRDIVASLAPRTVPELLLWVCLSFTAGFCEEHIFRGYLLSQSLIAMRRFALPSWLAATLSVLATSVLFGSLHLYEGVGGAVIVGLLGAVLATMTLVLGNLRAVIIAHFLQDFLGGVAYYISHLRHTL